MVGIDAVEKIAVFVDDCVINDCGTLLLVKTFNSIGDKCWLLLVVCCVVSNEGLFDEDGIFGFGTIPAIVAV